MFRSPLVNTRVVCTDRILMQKDYEVASCNQGLATRVEKLGDRDAETGDVEIAPMTYSRNLGNREICCPVVDSANFNSKI